MRYTRFEFMNSKDVDLKKFIIKFIILIPVMGIIIGFIVSKFIIVPNMPDSIEEKQNPTAYVYNEITPRKYYTVQTGVFLSVSNARILADRLKYSNLSSYINMEDKYARVIACASTDRDFINRRMQMIRSVGYDCVEKEINIKARVIPDELKNKRDYALASMVIASIGEAVDNYCDLLMRYNSKSIDDKILNEKAKALYQDIWGKVNEFKVSKEIKNHDLSELEGDFDSMCILMSEISDDLSVFEERVIKAVYIYIKIVDDYNKNMPD